jgi:large subunit ribosomal protein L1
MILRPQFKEAKAGRVEYRCDRAGVVNVPIGKLSFTPEALLENANAVL